jgi:hypothetical protein
MPPIAVEAMPVGNIFLYLSNPRHEPVAAEDKAIEYLCNNENVLGLAKDICENGTNPLERFALIPTNQNKSKAGAKSYYAAEGNRRLCAIKLLNDPDLAPKKMRPEFAKLSAKWTRRVTTVPGVIFGSFDEARTWLKRMHGGYQNGIGRKDWSADQTQRFNGGNKNKLALALLDFAQKNDLITGAERKGKLTTTTRFAENPVLKEALGINIDRDEEELQLTRPLPDFLLLLTKFTRDLVDKRLVNSRMNGPEIKAYARTLSSLPGMTNERVSAKPLDASTTSSKRAKAKGEKRPTPIAPAKAPTVRHQQEIQQALEDLDNEKLLSLYHSICVVELDHHTPLVAIGVWAFFEVLTACAGRADAINFAAFLSNDKLRSYAIGGKLNGLRAALERITEYGNTTKHHSVAATYNGEQLNNDMTALKDVILKCLEEAAQRPVATRAV